MKFVSRLALAAILSLGTASMVAVPAVAQKNKKGEAAAGPKLELSDAFRTPAAAAENAIKAKDAATAQTQLDAARAVAKNDSERFYVNYLGLQLGILKQDNAAIGQALDALIPDPHTPAAQLPAYNFVRASLLFKEKKQAQAIPYLIKARDLGSTEHDIPLLLAQAYFESGKTGEGAAEIEKAMEAERAAGRKPPADWYSYVVPRLYKAGDRAGTTQWQLRYLKDYPSPANWRTVIALYRDSLNSQGQQLNKGQKIDLYRLQDIAGALADQNDIQDYANAAQNSGLPWEAKRVIDTGRKSGKLPASAAEANSIYGAATSGIAQESSLTVYETKAKSDPTGKGAASTGDAYLASGNAPKAVEMYQLALTKGGVDADEVNTRLGIALTQAGQKPAAKEAFAKVQAAPRSDIAKMWVSWIDMNP